MSGGGGPALKSPFSANEMLKRSPKSFPVMVQTKDVRDSVYVADHPGFVQRGPAKVVDAMGKTYTSLVVQDVGGTRVNQNVRGCTLVPQHRRAPVRAIVHDNAFGDASVNKLLANYITLHYITLHCIA